MSKSDGRKPHTNDVCKEPNKVALPWSSSNNFEKKNNNNKFFILFFLKKKIYIYIYIGFFNIINKKNQLNGTLMEKVKLK